jgi:hypothetical protein
MTTTYAVDLALFNLVVAGFLGGQSEAVSEPLVFLQSSKV